MITLYAKKEPKHAYSRLSLYAFQWVLQELECSCCDIRRATACDEYATPFIRIKGMKIHMDFIQTSGNVTKKC
jgi:hypothetical protein